MKKRQEKFEDFCQPSNYTGPYSLSQVRGLLAEADSIAGDGGKYRLNFGPIGNHHSEDTYPTYDELCAQMWAMRLCKHPETAWFNLPADPGIVSNERYTREMFDQLPEHFKTRVNQIIAEDDRICEEGKETESIEEASFNLIEAAERALKYLKYGRAIHAKEREECVEQIASAIEDMQLWMEGIAESNQTPAQMGWVGSNGQP